jgi:molybdenum cofactor cytidylyltransferase
VIAAVILAAGASTRMGRQKLVLPLSDGRLLVRATVEQVVAAGLDDVVVVTGSDGEAVALALARLPVRTVRNPRYAEGQSTSLRAGLDALRPGTTAAVIALGDQLLPGPEVIRDLVAAFRRTGRPIVVPVYRGRRGNPVLFAATLFDELRAVTGDRGGREVIARDLGRIAEVTVDLPVPGDIDTPGDYEAARGAADPGARGPGPGAAPA